ncbi:MAG: hypothetical protein JW984_06530 [Deltaproteobacteria bacterium]|uniref:Uncharacterized protein n=1 Tax=Candidatus Zymogenus saltonus TaxID=2844893 RepID=A0A9D8PNW5_9DELT|nr:hypothetical protein [Candidatus Zymogenus saltonus]
MAKGKETGLSRGLKAVFAVHGIISLISGVLLLFIPLTWAKSMQWALLDPEPIRVIGAFTLSLAIKDLFGYLAKQWSEVRIVVLFEVVWTLFAALTFLRSVMLGLIPATFWMMVILFAAFFVAWGYFYVKYRKQ